MNFIKRALYSVMKRKTRSMLLLVTFVVIINLVLAGISIQASSVKAGELARHKLGGEVTLELNMDKIMAEMRQGGGGTRISRNGFQREPITLDMATSLTTLEHVIAYNFTTTGHAKTKDFEYYKDEDDSAQESDDTEEVEGAEEAADDAGQPGAANNGTSGDGMGQGQPNRIMMGAGGNMMTAEIALEGVTDSEWQSNFMDGTNVLVDGRTLTLDDVDSNAVLVEQRLAEINGWQVGDTFELSSLAEEEQTYELEIVGIYKTSQLPDFNLPFDIPIMHPYNTMFTSYTMANHFKIAVADGADTNAIDQVIYYLDDPIHVETFKEAAATVTTIDWETFRLNANDNVYERMIGPIENIASQSKQTVYVVSIAGAVILALILMLSIKERMHELGVLLSLGESKLKLCGQIFAEILLVALVASAISGLTGQVIAQTMADSLLDREVALSDDVEQQSGGRGFGGPIRIGGGGIMSGFPGGANAADVQVVDEIAIQVSFSQWMQLLGVGLVIMIIAVVLPIVSILRYHPRTILSRND